MSESKVEILKSENQVGVSIKDNDKTIIISKKFGDPELTFDVVSEDEFSNGSYKMSIDDLFTTLMLVEQEELAFIEEELGIKR